MPTCEPCPAGQWTAGGVQENPRECDEMECVPMTASSSVGAISPTATCRNCPSGEVALGEAEQCHKCEGDECAGSAADPKRPFYVIIIGGVALIVVPCLVRV
jgi:hypothetical protein